MYMRFFLFYVENLLSHFNMAAPSEMKYVDGEHNCTNEMKRDEWK